MRVFSLGLGAQLLKKMRNLLLPCCFPTSTSYILHCSIKVEIILLLPLRCQDEKVFWSLKWLNDCMKAPYSISMAPRGIQIRVALKSKGMQAKRKRTFSHLSVALLYYRKLCLFLSISLSVVPVPQSDRETCTRGRQDRRLEPLKV